jgi:ferric-dicitrate binding protein FerR (iron transport regulator)
VLPLVRREALLWKAATDSLRTADAAHYRAFQSVRGALQDERLVTANETAKAEAWRGRARKRGLLNYLLLALVGGVSYLSFK